MKSRLRILWLKSGPLHPLDTGGKIRTYNTLRELKEKHQITFLALCAPATTDAVKIAAQEFSHQQIWIPWRETGKRSMWFLVVLVRNCLFSGQPYVIQKYFSTKMARKIQELEFSNQFDLIVCDFLTPAVNLFVKDQTNQTPTLLFQHNVESLIWKRLFENATGVLKRAYFKNQWKRMEKFERETCERCDAVIGVSDDDCHILRSQFGLANVLGSVPTGVDLSYFCPSTKSRKPHSLIFLGSMDWMPNIDAAVYFAEKIFPAIKERFADATFTIVGRNPVRQVKELERLQSGIFVTGTVADVRPYLAEAEAMIVPLRIGGGTRIKIYEGMATGIPIVSSTIGAEGLPVIHGENILLADAPDKFAEAIGELFERSDLRKQIGAGGRALVERQFSWESVTKVFEQYCFEASAQPKS
jgi:polysaccharide biosynthesis protein PslH